MSRLETASDAYAPPARGRRRRADASAGPRARWGALGTLLVVLVLLRLAIPIVLAPALSARLSRALGTHVQIGDVGFAPLDAVVTLHHVAARAPGAAADAAPAIVADRVRVDLQWLPLLRRAVLVRELALESARIDVGRLTGGAAALDVFAGADPARELPPGWTFALDRIVLEETRLRLPDGAPGAPVLEVAIRDARMSTLPRRTTAFGRAPNLRVDALADGGRVRIDGSADVTPQGLAVDARIRARDVPLARLRPYVADLGWSAVAGRVSGRLDYTRAPGRRDVLTGRLLGRGIAVHVPAAADPALAIPKAIVDVDAIDLRARRVAIAALTLRGATLAARADAVAPLPLLAGAPASSGGAVPRRDGPAWRWKIGRFAAPTARVRVGEGAAAAVISASVSGESLGPDAYWSPLRATFRGGGGVAAFDGTAHMTRGLAIDGRLTAADVDVAAFARAVGLPWAELAQAGRGAADLSLSFAAGATDGPPLGVHGRASVTDLWLAGPDPSAFAAGAARVDLRVAGIGPRGDGDRSAGAAGLRISDATVHAPYALFTRTPDGWLLPPIEAGAQAALVVDGASMRGGRVVIVDQAAEPEAAFDVVVRDAWASRLRLPGVTFGELTLAASERRLGPFELVGFQRIEGRRLELSARSVPLPAVAPYLARAGLPYRFHGGTGSFLTRVALGSYGWTAETTLTLRDPFVTGDDAAVQRSLGMPVDAALGALRDPNGDATLRLVLTSPGGGTPGPDMVASAVRDAIVRAGELPIPHAPLRIAFAAGTPEPTRHGAREIARIADLLRARPDLVVELTAFASREDRRWLAAQALAGDGERRGGFLGLFRALGMRGVRGRVEEALEAGAGGGLGRLDAADEAALEDVMADRRRVDDGRLAALRAARLTRVSTLLADHHAVRRARVVAGDAPPDERAVPPAVGARIAVDARAPWRSAPWHEEGDAAW